MQLKYSYSILLLFLTLALFSFDDDKKATPKKNKHSDVIEGENNWLFYLSNEMKSYQGKEAFTEEQLKKIAEELKTRNEEYTKKGITFYFAVSPTKLYFYNKYLPEQYQKKSDNNWNEQVTKYISENTDIKVINLLSEMQKKQDDFLLYYKLDNHWTNYAGFMASNIILERMKKDFRKLHLNNLKKDFELETKEKKTGNLLGMLGSKDPKYTDINYVITCKKKCNSFETEKSGYKIPAGFTHPYEECRATKDKGRPRLLLITESFGGAMFPYLSEQFSHSTKIFDKWEYKRNYDIVEKEKPDIILLMVLESHLKALLPVTPKAKPAKKDQPKEKEKEKEKELNEN